MMFNATPDISIVIPCFNAATSLRAAVESIDRDIQAEIIIVDDGSTDISLDVCRELARESTGRLIAIMQVNAGPASARNRGLAIARGKYLCFLDSDDLHVSGFLSKAIQLLEEDIELVCVEGTMQIVDGPAGVQPWHLRVMEATSPSTIVLRTDAARNIGGFPIDPAFRGESGGEDGAFRHELSRFGSTYKLDQPILKYVVKNSAHFKLFLERARFENGQVVFTRHSPEELDGSLQRALSAYRREVAVRMLDKTLEHVKRNAFAVMGFANDIRKIHGIPLYRAADYSLLNQLAHIWPAQGDVVGFELDPDSLRWLEMGQQASKRGKLLAAFASSDVPPELTIRLLAVGERSSDFVRLWIERVSRDGLVVIDGAIAAQLKLEHEIWEVATTFGSSHVLRRR
jgi:glycosyltransferase involved in cell wall biosynthesis